MAFDLTTCREPVGAQVMPRPETEHLVTTLLGGLDPAAAPLALAA